MTTLVIETSDGRQVAVTHEGYGGVLRFGVGTPGVEESGVWRVWSNAKGGDVYLSARSLARVMKVSLHESGDWRFQWTDSYWESGHVIEHAPTSLNRIIAKWKRPEPLGAGVTRAITIIFPSDDLSEPAELGRGSDEIYWEPSADSGTAIGFHILLMKPDQGVLQLTGFKPIAGWDLASGETVMVMVSRLLLTNEQKLDLAKDKMRALSIADASRLAEAGHPRLALFGFNEYGFPIFWDLSTELVSPIGPIAAGLNGTEF